MYFLSSSDLAEPAIMLSAVYARFPAEAERGTDDGYCIYAIYIPPFKHQVLPKTQLTKVEVPNPLCRKHLNSIQVNDKGENTRVRHYLARLKRQTLCYSKSLKMLRYSVRLLMHYLKFKQVPIPARSTLYLATPILL